MKYLSLFYVVIYSMFIVHNRIRKVQYVVETNVSHADSCTLLSGSLLDFHLPMKAVLNADEGFNLFFFLSLLMFQVLCSRGAPCIGVPAYAWDYIP